MPAASMLGTSKVKPSKRGASEEGNGAGPGTNSNKGFGRNFIPVHAGNGVDETEPDSTALCTRNPTNLDVPKEALTAAVTSTLISVRPAAST